MTEPAPDQLVKAVRAGDTQALAAFYALERARLWRLVHFRLDPRLAGRIDADDVLQDAYLDAVHRLAHFTGDTPTSLFIWLRLIVEQTLIDLHRKHLGAQMRSAGREVALGALHGHMTDSAGTAASLSFHLLASITSPSAAAARAEAAARVEQAIAGMDPIDREILALRHFEELTNAEVAQVLGIQPKAASIRYIRALARLKDVLAQFGATGEGTLG